MATAAGAEASAVATGADGDDPDVLISVCCQVRRSLGANYEIAFLQAHTIRFTWIVDVKGKIKNGILADKIFYRDFEKNLE